MGAGTSGLPRASLGAVHVLLDTRCDAYLRGLSKEGLGVSLLA